MRPKKPNAREGETFEHFAASRAKWDFSEASLKEHGILDNEMRMECWAYEFSRENEQLVEAIRVWRASFAGSMSFAQLKRASAGSPMLRIPRNKQQGIAGRFVTIRFPAFYVFSPEWPDKSFLEIGLAERRHRIALAKDYSWYTWQPNWEKGLDEYPNLEADPKSFGLHKQSGWNQLLSDLMASAASNNKLRAFLDKEPANVRLDAQYLDPKDDPFIYAQAECVLFRIPWKYDDKVILKLMAKWLKENRPEVEIPAKVSGRAKTGKTRLQNMKERLEMLGKWRLVKQNHGDISTLHPLESKKPLFRDRWRWDQTNEVVIKERRLFDPIITPNKEKRGEQRLVPTDIDPLETDSENALLKLQK
jgi:hypothetical protein